MQRLSRTGAAVITAFALCASASCAFDLADVAPSDAPQGADSGGGNDSGNGGGDVTTGDENVTVTPDAVSDVINEPTVVDGCSATGCFAMPTGFTLVAFGASATNSACPSGFAQPLDYVEGPSVGAAGCNCAACQVTAPPSCAAGTLQGSHDTDGSRTCGNPSGAAWTNNPAGMCNIDGYRGTIGPADDDKFIPPESTGGTCTAASGMNQGAVNYAGQDRVCHPTTLPECAGQICPPQVGAPFRVCIASAGDVGCPQAFPVKHLVGTSATFTCTGGNCACKVTATCSGVVTLYRSQSCGGETLPLIADGACHPANGRGISYDGYIYVGTASNVACAGTGAPPAPSNLALVGATTMCCTP